MIFIPDKSGMLDDKIINELKKVADAKGIGYLQFVRMWVLENLIKNKAA